MTSLSATRPAVNLHADEWDARNVGQFALYAMRQPGNIATLVGDLHARPYKPFTRNGERKDNARIWVIEDAQGHVLAEEPSLYKAIHRIAK
jgi:hypothetical protein